MSVHLPHASASPHRLRRRTETHPWRTYALAWLGGPVIGIANGVARETLYADSVGDRTAHQLSTATAIALFFGYLWFLERRWPIPSRRLALRIGALWLALTVGFEFAFGHWGDGKSWDELLADYNLLKGRLWPLVLAWLAIGPLAIRELQRRLAR
jgi:hypothetical protein